MTPAHGADEYKLGVAIFGAGRAGHGHARAIASTAGAQLVVGDLLDREVVEAVFRQGFDGVLHFAALALILAALGIHGILSYLVAQRRREIGVQLALGASPAMVVGSMISQGMGLTFAGLLG